MLLSLLTPAFNEAANLPALHARIVSTMSELGIDWEWVIVDDHSRDDTFRVIEGLAAQDARVRGHFRRASGGGPVREAPPAGASSRAAGLAAQGRGDVTVDLTPL